MPRDEITELIVTSLSFLASVYTADQFCQSVFAINILREVANLYEVLPLSGDIVSSLSVFLQMDSVAITHMWLAAITVSRNEAGTVAKSVTETYSTGNLCLLWQELKLIIGPQPEEVVSVRGVTGLLPCSRAVM